MIFYITNILIIPIEIKLFQTIKSAQIFVLFVLLILVPDDCKNYIPKVNLFIIWKTQKQFFYIYFYTCKCRNCNFFTRICI